jgi:glycerol-1-phosphate dehydrogenase [NAD(P)+]
VNTIEENTNVTSLRIGSGVIKNIGKDAGRFVVATMEIPWKLTTKLLGAEARKVVIIESIEESWLNEQLSDLPGCDCIIGIGGGQAIDAGKYFAWKLEIPFISIPTIMSVNAFVTPAAGIRRNHQVVYLGEVSPNPLIIDYDIIRSAPRELNIAGIGDLLSIHTASFDWEHAQSKGMSEYPFSSSITRKASEILGELYPHIPAIRNAENEGLKAIALGYMKLNTICLPLGHFRVEEGSEHYLFYELEERLQQPFIHGNIVGLGIYLMSRLQRNDSNGITEIMDEVGLGYHPNAMGIKKEDLLRSLLNLNNFVKNKHKLWYTCINDVPISREWAMNATENLRF